MVDSLDLPSPYNRDQNVTFGDTFTNSKVTSTKIVNTNNYTDTDSGYVTTKIS